jgi:hypothetical protein
MGFEHESTRPLPGAGSIEPALGIVDRDAERVAGTPALGDLDPVTASEPASLKHRRLGRAATRPASPG